VAPPTLQACRGAIQPTGHGRGAMPRTVGHFPAGAGKSWTRGKSKGSSVVTLTWPQCGKATVQRRAKSGTPPEASRRGRLLSGGGPGEELRY